MHDPPEWFDPFVYQAALDRVVDGDTYDLHIDLGFRIDWRRRVRLQGVDTAEENAPRGTREYYDAQEHTAFAIEWFRSAAKHPSDWPLIIRTDRDERGKYGRHVARVWAKRGIEGDSAWGYEADIAGALVSEFGEGVVYDG